MSFDLDFVKITDKPALLAINAPDLLATARMALNDLDYKCHTTSNPGEFLTRFAQVQYQVVIIEELFCASNIVENDALLQVQIMPMAQRRHAAILLVGDSFETLHAMQAFQMSVHAVINRNDFTVLPQILQQVIADNQMLLGIYRDTIQRIATGQI